ncbi:MAG: M15 family metallopeptidase [Pseudomonadota bacterium]
MRLRANSLTTVNIVFAGFLVFVPSAQAGGASQAPAEKSNVVERGSADLEGSRALEKHREPTPPILLSAEETARRLATAYPGALTHIGDGQLRWRDGAVMHVAPRVSGPSVSSRRPGWLKSAAAWLQADDLRAIFRDPYPIFEDQGEDRQANQNAVSPITGNSRPPSGDPGRSRPARFFTKLYGDCRRGDVIPHLVEVPWLPAKFGKRSKVRVTQLHGVAKRVAAISAALEQLPARFDRFLTPLGGGYACRVIAGTGRVSAHGLGIAIDIAVAPADYWRWAAKGRSDLPTYRNKIPPEIVKVFEAHGFIWGGRWRHFDTMHFEYRPELLLPPTRGR